MNGRDKYRPEIRKLEMDLRALQAELLLKRKGFVIQYSVDFHSLERYAFPFFGTDILEGSKRMSTAILNPLSSQVALDYLFAPESELPPVILVTPYVGEMRSRIRTLTSEYVAHYTSAIVSLVSRARERLPLKEMREAALAQDEAKLINYLESEFKDLLLFLKAFSGRTSPFVRMASPFKNGRIGVSHEVWPNLPRPPKLLSREYCALFTLLESARKDSEYVNRTDSAATSWIKYLNECLIPKKHVLVFLTTSSILYEFLQRKKVGFSKNIAGIPLPLARDIGYLVAYIIHKNLAAIPKDVESLLQEVQRSLAWIDKYNNLRPRSSEMHPVLDALRQRLETLENLQLAAASDELLRGIVARVEQLGEEDSAMISDLVTAIQQEDFQAQLLRRITSTVQQLDQDAEVLQAIFGVRADETKDLLVPRMAVKLGRAVLTGKLGPNRLLYVFEFIDQPIKQLFERTTQATTLLSFLKILSQAAELRFSGDTSPELHLFFGYLLLKLDPERFQADALREVELGLSHAKPAQKPQLLLMKSILMRWQDQLETALDCCKQASALAEGDPRYLKEAGLISWKLVEHQAQSEDISLSRLIFEPHVRREVESRAGASLDDAISCTRRAEEALQSDDYYFLANQIDNNLAFYLGIRGKAVDLEEAAKRCRSLQNESSRQQIELLPENTGVIALLKLRQARLREPASSERKKLVKEALDAFCSIPKQSLTPHAERLVTSLIAYAKRL